MLHIKCYNNGLYFTYNAIYCTYNAICFTYTATCFTYNVIRYTYNAMCYTYGAGYLSRCTDPLPAGRSGDRHPVRARFSAPVQTGPGDHPAYCRVPRVPGQFSCGKAAGTWSWPSSTDVKERVVSLLPLWAFMASSRIKITFLLACICMDNIHSVMLYV